MMNKGKSHGNAQADVKTKFGAIGVDILSGLTTDNSS